MYKRIRTIEQLKEAVKDGPREFAISLNYGLRSAKWVWRGARKRFRVVNCIDDSLQFITDEELFDRSVTLIGEAMKKGAFYKLED